MAESPQSGVKVVYPVCGKCGGLDNVLCIYFKKHKISKILHRGNRKLREKIKEHDFGRCRSKKAYRPWEIVYKEEFNSGFEAFNREKEIKKYKSGIKFKKLINPERWQSG